MIIKTARLTARVCITLIGILLILLALLSAGVRVGLPFVANYKPTIESRLSDYLRSPVAIGDLNLSWEGFGPMLKAENVAVYESSERKVTLDELLINLNLAKSVISGAPVINELTLVGAHGMERVRDTRGATSSNSNPIGKGVDLMAWLLTARKVGLLETEVTLIDEQSELRLVMQDLNIRAENDGDLHQLRVDVRLPAELGGNLEAGIDLYGPANALADADGDLYIKADSLQVKALGDVLKVGGLSDKLRRLESPVNTAVSLELWGKWQNGQLLSARGPVTTSDITNAVTGEKIADGASANIVLTGTEKSFSMAARDVIIPMGIDTVRIDNISSHWNGIVAGDTSSQTSNADSRIGRSSSLSLTADILNMQSVSELMAGVLSTSDPRLSTLISQASPVGELVNTSFEWFTDRQTNTLNLQSELRQLSAKPTEFLPGFGPINGRVDIVESLGEIAFSSESMNLPWPSLTDASLDLDSLKSVLAVDLRSKDRIKIDGDVVVADEGIDLTTRFKLSMEPGQSPHLDMQSRFSVSSVDTLKAWLPRKKLSPRLGAWFDRAVKDGEIEDGTVLFFGKLSDFPFDSGQGVFRTTAKVRDGELAFLPNWPVASDVNGEFLIDGATLTGRATNTALHRFDITQTQISIDNLKLPVLKVNGTGRGKLKDVIEFGVDGPLSKILKPALNDIQGNGFADMDLAITLPLYKVPKSDNTRLATNANASKPAVAPPPFAVNGSLFLNGNTVNVTNANLPLENVAGSIGFTNTGIRVNNLKARLLSQAVRLNAKTSGVGAKATTTFSLKGALEANDLLAHYKIPIDQFIRGASSWLVNLEIPHSANRLADSGIRLHMESDLVGTELLLPKPLNKTSASARSMRVDTRIRTGRTKQLWDIELDRRFHAVVDSSAQGMETLLLNLGSGRLSSAEIRNRKPGLHLVGLVGRVAADDWIDSISNLINALSESGSGEQEPILPISADLNIESFELGRRTLGPASFSIETDQTYISTSLSNGLLNGTVKYPREHWSKTTPLIARFKRIDMSVFDALIEKSEESNDRSQSLPLDPRLLPPIDARLARFTRGEQTFRNLVLRAQPDVSGLQVTTLGFAYDTMQMVGQGFWRLKDPQGVNPRFKDLHQTQLDLVVQSDDFGAGFAHIGFNDFMSRGVGSAEVRLSWPGAAYLPSLAILDGDVKLNIEQGSLIPVEPGAGRLVGLFALQALPRRLNLDFSDVSEQGMAFETLTGDATIENGLVDVELVQLTGPVGVIDIVGESNLKTQEIDQTITVLPRVSAALPIIGAISGGATAGVGALLATGFLKALGVDLDRIGLREYELTGTWDAPDFQVKSPTTNRKR